MAIIYQWDSLRKSNEVLETMLSLTDKKRRLNPFTCTYKKPSNNEVMFTLWYNPFGSRRYSFDPPSLKGTIKDTATGCLLSAEPKFVMAYIGNVVAVIMMIVFYIMGFAAIFADFHLSIIPSILFFLLAIGVTCRFIYTYKKYSKLKVHLAIMNAAASADYQIIIL